MSNGDEFLIREKLKLIIAATEMIRFQKLLAAMGKSPFGGVIPRPGDPEAMAFYKLIYEPLSEIHELETYRAKHIRIDPHDWQMAKKMLDESLGAIDKI